MNFPRPKSLNELILVGFGLVALPLLIAVLWALSSLDRLATQSEELVFTGVSATENNRLLTENLGSLERVARQYVILRNPDSLQLLRQDLATLENRLEEMQVLAEMASAKTALASIGDSARFIVKALDKDGLSTDDAQAALAGFATLRAQLSSLTRRLSTYVDLKLRALQESTRSAQRISAWQVFVSVNDTS